MCFRPPTASTNEGNVCPQCGKTIQNMSGVVLKKCPFCKAELAATPPAPPTSGSTTPSNPAVPNTPQAPRVPKPPDVR